MKKVGAKVIIPKERRILMDEQFKKEKVELSDKNVNDNQIKYCSDKIVRYVKQLELNHCSITSLGIFYLYGLKWINLKRIELMSNKIGSKGCYYLSKLKTSTLQTLFLNNNQICSSGINHLSKADWKNLTTLVLYYNHIADGTNFLVRACWMKIEDLHLGWNNLQDEQIRQMLLGQWKKINYIGLRNDIVKQVQEDEKTHQQQCDIFHDKFTKIHGFSSVKLIRHMTA